jgi:hypothetical protein
MNENGVIDSNSVLFHFLIPSFFAAVFSAILQGVGQTYATFTDLRTSNTFITNSLKEPSRS